MSQPVLLSPNLGAEEGSAWRRHLGLPAVRRAARLWSGLFASRSQLLELEGDASRNLPEQLAGDAHRAAFEFLEYEDEWVPWLSTPEEEAHAASRGLGYAAAPSAVVAKVHDKAFAVETARCANLVPEGLGERIRILDSAQLCDVRATLASLARIVDGWPEGRFVLKPRHGSSGRGQFHGGSADLESDAFRAALPRFARAGGAVLEPCLQRLEDLSAQFWVDVDGSVHLLGTLRQLLSPGGSIRGHAGCLEPDGRVWSGSAFDVALAGAARTLAHTAARAGFRGACGIDAFVYRGASGVPVLRPLVEFNARFTMGTVALGLIARAVRQGYLPERGSVGLLLAPSAGDVETLQRTGQAGAPLDRSTEPPASSRGAPLLLRCLPADPSGPLLWAADTTNAAPAALSRSSSPGASC